MINRTLSLVSTMYVHEIRTNERVPLYMNIHAYACTCIHVPVRGSALDLIESASSVSSTSSSAVISLLQLARGSVLIQYDIDCFF